MSYEMIISTPRVNCYGSRVLTEGIETARFARNPLLLWMHRRGGDTLPIGRVEGLRTDGDRLIGTPVFDTEDPFAARIARKWEKGFLRMASAGISIISVSSEPALVLPGQTRPTITRCRLEEVSIVDMGANDDAFRLYDARGGELRLSAGEDSPVLPLLENLTTNDNKTYKKMEKETLELLGLPQEADENAIREAVTRLRGQADEAGKARAALVNGIIGRAISEGRVKEEHRALLQRAADSLGTEDLSAIIALTRPAVRPLDIVRPAAEEKKELQRLSDIPAQERAALREDDPARYAALYKAEYGIDMPQ